VLTKPGKKQVYRIAPTAVPTVPKQAAPGRIETREDRQYSRALKLNPHLADLTERLGLVNPKTGRAFNATTAPVSDLPQAVRERLHQIAQKLLQGSKRLNRQAMIQGLQAQAPGLSLNRAERGLKMLLEAGAVQENQGTYTMHMQE
jgi:hypothetical protein